MALLALLMAAVGQSTASTPMAPSSSVHSSAGPDRSLADFPENAEFRGLDYASFITAPPQSLRRSKALVRANAWAEWRREVVVSGGYQYLVYSAKRADAWPLYSQGSWIIKRSLTSGAFIQAKVFLKTDPGTFLRIYPDGDRSRLDLVIRGGVFVHSAPLPWPFSRSLTARMGDIVRATRDRIDWGLLEPDPADSATVARLSEEIRSRLHQLNYSDDGGLDAEGKLVFIADGAPQPAADAGLNCSGFAQWVVDGILKPVNGQWLDRSFLSIKHIDTRKSASEPEFEDSLDPYFGLDWTRNLALAAGKALEGLDDSDPRSADVRQSPIALVETSASPTDGGAEYLDFPPYEEDAGFASEGIPALLWWLAVTDPGYFYLASISQQDKAGLRHHYHVSVLLPWFDENEAFHVDVYESDAETSLKALVDRTKGQMIHLVRVKAESVFDPPDLSASRLP